MDFNRPKRLVVAAALAASGASSVTACAPPSTDTKVIVLGFDGMDPRFVERHQDRLPNLMRLAQSGGFKDLETVMPPQSPVAWSTVITGMTPAGHGIFDFVHPASRRRFAVFVHGQDQPRRSHARDRRLRGPA